MESEREMFFDDLGFQYDSFLGTGEQSYREALVQYVDKRWGNKTDSKVPDSIRTGLITGISVVLGFALNLIQRWVLEEGEWNWIDIIFIFPMLIGIFSLIFSLFRALSLEKSSNHDFKTTTKRFIIGVLIVLFSILIGGLLPD